MKTFAILISTMLLVSCSFKKELTNDDAINQIKQANNYPKIIDFDIYCSDPEAARKVLNAGLESSGMVTVQRTQKLGDVGQPLLSFKAKAKPYLLTTPEKDKARNIQKVKLADEDLVDITNIKTNETGNKAVVNYTTTYKNVTPFSTLVSANYNDKKTNKAYFSLGDQGWKLVKKPDIDFIELEK